jgi:hypothetical protein
LERIIWRIEMKKETYEFLRDEFSQVFLNIEDPRLADDVSNAIKELLPVPDPETGLVPCWCGGKAEFGAGCKVFCSNCFIATLEYFTHKDAKNEWNTARGYKEDA